MKRISIGSRLGIATAALVGILAVTQSPSQFPPKHVAGAVTAGAATAAGSMVAGSMAAFVVRTSAVGSIAAIGTAAGTAAGRGQDPAIIPTSIPTAPFGSTVPAG